MTQNVIIFAGQSGIGANECLNRIKNEITSIDVEIVSVEKRIEKNTKREFDPQILMEKIPYQYKVWKEAFDEIIHEINSEPEKFFFLTMHSVYYHQDKSEFVSAIDYNLIGQLEGKVKAMIVLIDDIYDIYYKLTRPTKMYDEVIGKDKDPFEALFKSILNLNNILEWRQIEITISRSIAKILNLKTLYIVATKHPILIIKRMVEKPFEDLKFYYLSHPISQIRRDASAEIPSFAGELKSFMKDIENYDDLILFIPTTIDEYRIKLENERLMPGLTPRWSLPFSNEKLITNIAKGAPSDFKPLNPLNYIPSDNIEKKPLSYLLSFIEKNIYKQITARDLSLVEQSKNGLIVYRPYFPYKNSGGVLREIEHNDELIHIFENSPRNLYILSVKKDLVKARIHFLFEDIITFVVFNNDQNIYRKKLRAIKLDWMSNSTYLDIFSEKTNFQPKSRDIRTKIEQELPITYKFDERFLEFLPSLDGGSLAIRERKRYRGFKTLFNKIYIDRFEQFILNPDDYKKLDDSNDLKLNLIF